MPLLSLVITLVVIGVLLGLLNTYGGPYIDGKVLKIINAVVIIAIILWLLSIFIGFGNWGSIRVGRIQ